MHVYATPLGVYIAAPCLSPTDKATATRFVHIIQACRDGEMLYTELVDASSMAGSKVCEWVRVAVTVHC